jgi:hypothetical protein
MIIYKCTKCNGENVFCDAYVNLNDSTDIRQFEETFCEDCEGYCRTYAYGEEE